MKAQNVTVDRLVERAVDDDHVPELVGVPDCVLVASVVIDVDVRVGGHNQFVEVCRNTFDCDRSVFSSVVLF
jgi:hypothetical protein